MTVLFKVELRKPDENPKTIATVKAVEAGLVGYYDKAGVPWKVDEQAVNDALPHHYKAAFARSSKFWYDTNDNATCILYGSKGQVLASIWATPYEV